MGPASFVIFKVKQAPPLLQQRPQGREQHMAKRPLAFQAFNAFSDAAINIPPLCPLRKECVSDRWKEASVLTQMQDHKFAVEEMGDNYLGGFCGLFQHLVFYQGAF